MQDDLSNPFNRFELSEVEVAPSAYVTTPADRLGLDGFLGKCYKEFRSHGAEKERQTYFYRNVH